MVTTRLDDGRRACKHHLSYMRSLDEHERQAMEERSVEGIMNQRILALAKMDNMARKVVGMPDIEEQMSVLDSLADAKDDHTIKFKKQIDPAMHPNMRTGVKRSPFLGIDIEHYTPEFKYDYIYMMMQSIRRAEAHVNIYSQQLQRIEAEEAILMQTKREGSMIADGKVVDFSNTETRYAIPIELKIKLMDNLTKAEAHLAKLLKQMQETPLAALMVLRKMGVRWDREAAMMVLNKVEKQEGQILTDFGGIAAPLEPVDLPKAIELVAEDPKMMKTLKTLATDDDW